MRGYHARPSLMDNSEMDAEWVRALCLGFPNTTESVQWEHLVFKVGGKMYAMANLEPSGHWLSFKCSTESFVELVEVPGIVPAPYLARAQWVALENHAVLSPGRVQALLREGYEVILAKLPKKVRAGLGPR